MTSGNTYTNVHTANFPNGEIRGQIVLVAAVAEDDHGNGNGNDNGNGNGNGSDNHDGPR
jgi:CHRD domain